MNKNPYDSLRLQYVSDPEEKIPSAEYNKTVTSAREETVAIHTVQLKSGKWIYGYVVYWADGRTSCKAPDPEIGVFNTRREAMLHAVGFMKMFIKYFTEKTQASLNSFEQELTQGTLFN